MNSLTEKQQANARRMLKALENRGFNRSAIASQLGYSSPTGVSHVLNQRNGISRDKYERLTQWYQKETGFGGTTTTNTETVTDRNVAEQVDNTGLSAFWLNTESYNRANASLTALEAKLDRAESILTRMKEIRHEVDLLFS